LSEFEFHILFVEYINVAHSLFALILSVLSGFLVSSYLVAHKLDGTMVRVVVGVFTVAMLIMTAQLLFVWMDTAAIAREIHAFPADWHFVSKTGDTALVLSGIVYCGSSMLGYIAALVFFFSQRKRGERDLYERTTI